MAKKTQIIDNYVANLPNKDSVTGTEKIVVSDGGENKGVELQKVKDFAVDGVATTEDLKNFIPNLQKQTYADYYSSYFPYCFYGKELARISISDLISQIQSKLETNSDIKANSATIGEYYGATNATPAYFPKGIGLINRAEKTIIYDNGYVYFYHNISVHGIKVPGSGYSKNEVFNAVAGLTQVYTQSEVDEKLSTKAGMQQVSDNAEAIKNIMDLLKKNKAYGVEFDTSVSSPTCTRIGNMDLHKSLPVQSLMRGCLLNDDGKVNKYLDANDWTSETRDGSQGQVMVEIPEFWWKFEEEGTKRRVWLSAEEIPTFKHHPKQYVSAYEASLDRSNNKLASVCNSSPQYRGGNNASKYDGTYRSLLNRPVTQISRTNFRNYARKRKAGSTEWNCMTYDMQKTLYWLFVVEYATLNSQAAYNASPISEGFHQGGLGDGVTTFSVGDWGTFNGYNPFVPCGLTDSLGNRTGIVEYTINNEAESNPITKTFQVPRYRGVENPFGHIWQWTDGIDVRISPNTENGGDGLSKVFVCSDPSKFNDSNYEGYSHVGNEARSEGCVKEIIFGEGGEIMPKVVGGGSTTYFCDYHYTDISTVETLRGVLFGGNAATGALGGFAYAPSAYAPSYTYAHIGSRLCFIPATA